MKLRGRANSPTDGERVEGDHEARLHDAPRGVAPRSRSRPSLRLEDVRLPEQAPAWPASRAFSPGCSRQKSTTFSRKKRICAHSSTSTIRPVSGRSDPRPGAQAPRPGTRERRRSSLRARARRSVLRLLAFHSARESVVTAKQPTETRFRATQGANTSAAHEQTTSSAARPCWAKPNAPSAIRRARGEAAAGEHCRGWPVRERPRTRPSTTGNGRALPR